MTAEIIGKRLTENEIPFDPQLPEKMRKYMLLLTEWNSRIDLTAVTEEEEMLDKHLADSLTVLKTGLIPKTGSLIDVGTGAGFPGLMLAMACPGLQVTLLDSLRKRLEFLQAVLDEVEISNVRLVHARAEEGGHRPELRECFDLATARAVAPLNILCEFLLPYVRIGGRALCWKGPAISEELEAGKKAAEILGGRVETPESVSIAGRNWDHLILPIRKVRSAPKAYPRRPGLPKEKPLGL